MWNLLQRITARLREIMISRRVSLYLIFGLALSVSSLWVFASVAEDVLEGDPIVVADAALATELHNQATPLSTSFYLIISWFGAQGIVVVGVVVGIFYVLRREWLNLTFWLIALGGGGLLNALMKQIVARPRPVFVDPIALEQNYSFPSAHAMTSLITFGMVAYFLWVGIPNRYARIMIVFAATLLIILIGISRMALGVHYFSDVIGGFAAGGIWLGVCIITIAMMKRREG